MNVTIGLAFIAGLVSFLSPCVLPIVPAYIGYLSNRVTDTVSTQISMSSGGTAAMSRPTLAIRFNTLLHGIAFVLGFTIVFVAFGLLVTTLTSFVNVNVLGGTIGRIGGVIIIFFGLHFMGIVPSIFRFVRQQTSLAIYTGIVIGLAVIGVVVMLWGFTGQLDVWNSRLWEYEVWAPTLGIILAALWLLWLFLSNAFFEPRTFVLTLMKNLDSMFYADTRPEISSTGNGLGSSVLMGMVFSAGWTPCIGPVYSTILAMAQTGDVGYAIPLLTAYSLGLGIPFLLCALLLDGAKGVLHRLQSQMRTIKLVAGAFLVFIGVMVASGKLQDFSAGLSIRFTDFSIKVEDCIVGWAQGDVLLNEVGSCLSAPNEEA